MRSQFTLEPVKTASLALEHLRGLTANYLKYKLGSSAAPTPASANELHEVINKSTEAKLWLCCYCLLLATQASSSPAASAYKKQQQQPLQSIANEPSELEEQPAELDDSKGQMSRLLWPALRAHLPYICLQQGPCARICDDDPCTCCIWCPLSATRVCALLQWWDHGAKMLRKLHQNEKGRKATYLSMAIEWGR